MVRVLRYPNHDVFRLISSNLKPINVIYSGPRCEVYGSEEYNAITVDDQVYVDYSIQMSHIGS